MNIIKTFECTFEENIVAVHQKNAEELIVLLQNEVVVKHHVITNETKELFSIKTSMNYSDGGFDINSPCSIYAMDDIIVVSNDKKTHAIIHYHEKYTIRIQREDYHADISKFPIALFKNQDNIPHLIYATAWNRVDVMNLENCHNLTADKSLIEANAEESHAKYANPEKHGYHIWPSNFDYFYADLKMSPDNKHFLSKGWSWGSSDAFYVFNTEDFIKNSRINYQLVGHWEHDGRAACWIANNKIVVCCNAVIEEYDDADENNPIEFVHYQLKDGKFEQTKRTKVTELTDTNFEFEFLGNQQLILAYRKKEKGIYIFDLDGDILLKNETHKIDHLSPENLTFSTIEKNELTLFQLEL